MENFDAILAGMPQDVDLIGDQWTTYLGWGAEARAAGFARSRRGADGNDGFRSDGTHPGARG